MTQQIRGAISYIYTSYAVAHYSNMFLANFISNRAVENVTEKFTLSFSNTPGPIKPFVYDTKPEVCSTSVVPYLMVPGRLGLNIACISMINSFRFAVTSDSGLFDQNEYLVKLIEQNLEE